MAFEHEQFRRFLQNDAAAHHHHHHQLPQSSATTRTATPNDYYQAPQIGGGRTTTAARPSISGTATTTTTTMMMDRRRRHSSSGGKKVSWSTTGSGDHYRKRCEPLTPRGKVAALVVCVKLALLCCWLVHELASGFDESQCLLLASTSSSNSNANQQQQQSPTMWAQQIEQQQQQQNELRENNANGHKYFYGIAKDADRNGHGNGLTNIQLRQEGDINLQQQKFQRQSEQQGQSGQMENGQKSFNDHRQLAATGNDQLQQPQQQQQSAAAAVPTKRRRKVILRRRLLRKGPTGGGGAMASATNNGNNNTSDIRPNGGAIRRVVWRVVPLKKLPNSRDEEEGEEDGTQNSLKNLPVRTKTGTVMLRRPEMPTLKLRRRIARRRTGGSGSHPIGLGRGSAAGGGMEEADAAATVGLDMSMIRESAWRNNQNNQQRRQPEQQHDENDASLSRRPKLAIYAALPVPEQLDQLIASMLCYARTVFDCWCLVQCFFSAIFLLGLHLRHRLLSMVPIVVDVVSIVLALIFGISTLMFPLILLMLLSAELPSRPLLLCFGLSTLIHVAIAVFAWGTFAQLKAVNTKGGGEGEEDENGKKNIGIGTTTTAMARGTSASKWGSKRNMDEPRDIV